MRLKTSAEQPQLAPSGPISWPGAAMERQGGCLRKAEIRAAIATSLWSYPATESAALSPLRGQG